METTSFTFFENYLGHYWQKQTKTAKYLRINNSLDSLLNGDMRQKALRKYFRRAYEVVFRYNSCPLN